MTLGRGAYSHILPRTIDEGDFSTPLRFRRNDNGRGKLTAIYRSADGDSLVGWWTSELVSW